MNNNYVFLIKLYAIWSALIIGMNMILVIERGSGINYICIATIPLGLIVVLFLHSNYLNKNMRVFEIELIISTISFSIIYVLMMLVEIRLMKISPYWIFIILIPYIAMFFLGIYTYFVAKAKKELNKEGKKKTSSGVGAAIITPIVGAFYIFYRRFIKNQSEWGEILFVMIIFIIGTSFIMWIVGLTHMEIHEKNKVSKIKK